MSWGEELAACGQEHREPAGKDQAGRGGEQQQDAVADDRCQKPITTLGLGSLPGLVSAHHPTLDLVARGAAP
jgi:hypothetical protein